MKLPCIHLGYALTMFITSHLQATPNERDGVLKAVPPKDFLSWSLYRRWGNAATKVC